MDFTITEMVVTECELHPKLTACGYIQSAECPYHKESDTDVGNDTLKDKNGFGIDDGIGHTIKCKDRGTLLLARSILIMALKVVSSLKASKEEDKYTFCPCPYVYRQPLVNIF